MLRSSHMPNGAGKKWRRSGSGNRFYNAAFGPKVKKSRLFVLIVLHTLYLDRLQNSLVSFLTPTVVPYVELPLRSSYCGTYLVLLNSEPSSLNHKQQFDADLWVLVVQTEG